MLAVQLVEFISNLLRTGYEYLLLGLVILRIKDNPFGDRTEDSPSDVAVILTNQDGPDLQSTS
jgi:hypothetical protein